MYTFGTLIALILIVEIGCTVAVFIFKDEVWHAINKELVEGLEKYDDEASQGVSDSWDKLQTEFECCGVKDYQDWSTVESFNKTASVPDSCCLEQTAGCGNDQLNVAQPTTINTTGCLTKLGAFIQDNIMFVGIGAATVVVLQLIGVIVACCLGRRMKELQNFV